MFQKEIDKLANIEFFQLAKREPDPRMQIRLLVALGYLESGTTKTDVVSMCRITFPTLRIWMLRFIPEVLEGLKWRQGRGRNIKLSTEHEENFRQHVEEL